MGTDEIGVADHRPPKNPLKSQAERVVAKFGGVPTLVALLAKYGRPRHRASIYRWLYPRGYHPNGKRTHGTGGLIPTSAWPDLLYVARMEGIFITQEDLDPRDLAPPKPLKGDVIAEKKRLEELRRKRSGGE